MLSTDGETFFCPLIVDLMEDVNAVRDAAGSTGGAFSVVYFPLSSVLASSEMLDALKEIARGDGAYDRNVLAHAANCIQNMKDLALAAVAKAEEKG